ncbi:MAG: TIGR02253 family HAD-type hydrolase [archaeon]
MIDAVFFDLDNTLIDFMKVKRASCEEAISAMIDAGLDIRKDAAMKILFELYDHYGLEYNKIFQRFLRQTIGRIDWKILAAGIVAYRRIRMGFLEPYPGVRRTLMTTKLGGIKLGIISDAPKIKAWVRLASLRFGDFFDVVVTYDDTRKLKPHSLPFERGLKRLSVAPENALMVGDRPERDITGARRVGMKTCFARYGAEREYRNVRADYVIDDIKDLLGIIAKENSQKG